MAVISSPAVIAGTITALTLAMFKFSPRMFGKGWSTGSHGIQPPEAPPLLAMIVQLSGNLMLALLVGLTESAGALWTAIAAILCCGPARGGHRYV